MNIFPSSSSSYRSKPLRGGVGSTSHTRLRWILFVVASLMILAHLLTNPHNQRLLGAMVSSDCYLPSHPVPPAYSRGMPPFVEHKRPPPPSTASSSSSSSPERRVDFVWVSDDENRLLDSLASICHFYTSPSTLHVILPDHLVGGAKGSGGVGITATLGKVCAGAPPGRFDIRVWEESQLVPYFTKGGPHSGTTRQMTLKLAAAAFVRDAAWYVVMDSDVYARRAFGWGDILVPSGVGGALRAKTDLDYVRHAQPSSWHFEAGHVLGTPVVRDTYEWCGSWAGHAKAVLWGESDTSLVDPLHPFTLGGVPGKGGVYGACHSGRGGATHVTPMVLSVALVTKVVYPRLEERGEGGGGKWYDAALGFHEARSAQCMEASGGKVHPGRFYSWTEYSLYFVAGVASGALDQYHDFRAGALLSFKHSVFDPWGYDFWDAGAVASDKGDTAPLFLVHSWIPREGARDKVHKLITAMVASH